MGCEANQAVSCLHSLTNCENSGHVCDGPDLVVRSFGAFVVVADHAVDLETERQLAHDHVHDPGRQAVTLVHPSADLGDRFAVLRAVVPDAGFGKLTNLGLHRGYSLIVLGQPALLAQQCMCLGDQLLRWGQRFGVGSLPFQLFQSINDTLAQFYVVARDEGQRKVLRKADLTGVAAIVPVERNP